MSKTREQLIKEAKNFVHKNAPSNFRGELTHKAEFFNDSICVTLYHKDPTYYQVWLYYEGKQPDVFRKDVVTSVRSQVM